MYAIIYSRRLIRVPIKDAKFAAPQFLTHFSSQILGTGGGGGDGANFTISYLTNSCGLSLKDAIRVSEKLLIRSAQNWDTVLEVLNKYEFTNAQISRLVARWPRILQSSSAKTLSPKLEFFKSIGVPPAVLSEKISQYPSLLMLSLGKYCIPWYDYLRSIVQSEKNVVSVFSRSPVAFSKGWPKLVPTNIQILRERRVPESSIALLLVRSPFVMVVRKEKFSTFVDRAVEMGFNESKASFVGVLQVFGQMSESTLKHKMDVYRRCGWSESDLNSAFLKYPFFMKFSEKRIRSTMDFLVSEVGFKPADVAKTPALLGYSIDRRMRPRWIIARILKAKGLMRESAGITQLFLMSEANFLKKHICNHGDIPQLLDIYRGKMSFAGIGLDGNVICKWSLFSDCKKLH